MKRTLLSILTVMFIVSAAAIPLCGCNSSKPQKTAAPVLSAAPAATIAPTATPEPDVMTIFTPAPDYSVKQALAFSDMAGMPEEWGSARMCNPFLIALSNELEMEYKDGVFTVSGSVAGKTELYAYDTGEETPVFEVRAVILDKDNTVIKWTAVGGLMQTLSSGESGSFTLSGTAAEEITTSDVITLIVNTTSPISTDTEGSGICIVGGSNITLNATNVAWPVEDETSDAAPASADE